MYKQERGCVWVLIPCFIVEWKKGLKDNPLCSDFIQLPLTVPILHLNAQQTGCCPMDLRFPLFLLASILGRHSPSHCCPTLGFNTSSRSHTLCVTLTPQSPETSSVNLHSISICLSDSPIIWPCCSWLYALSQFTLKSLSRALSWTVFHGSLVLRREAGSYEHHSLGYFADLPSLFISKSECHQQCPSLPVSPTQPFVATHLRPCTGLPFIPLFSDSTITQVFLETFVGQIFRKQLCQPLWTQHI